MHFSEIERQIALEPRPLPKPLPPALEKSCAVITNITPPADVFGF